MLKIRRRMRQGMGGVAVLLACAATAWADIHIQLKMDGTKLVQHERVIAFVVLSNDSSEPVVIGGDGDDAGLALEFIARPHYGKPVPRLTDRATLERLELGPGASRRVMVELSRFYDLRSPGSYSVAAYVEQSGMRFLSNWAYLDIVNGLPLKTIRRTVKNAPGSVRVFTLMYVARDQHEFLLVRVDDETAGRCMGVVTVGPLLRVVEPRMQVAYDGTVTVHHQVRPRLMATTLLRSKESGLYVLDQTYEKVGGPAVLIVPTDDEK